MGGCKGLGSLKSLLYRHLNYLRPVPCFCFFVFFFFSHPGSPQNAQSGQLQWLMTWWPQHPLFTDVAWDILCPQLFISIFTNVTCNHLDFTQIHRFGLPASQLTMRKWIHSGRMKLAWLCPADDCGQEPMTSGLVPHLLPTSVRPKNSFFLKSTVAFCSQSKLTLKLTICSFNSCFHFPLKFWPETKWNKTNTLSQEFPLPGSARWLKFSWSAHQVLYTDPLPLPTALDKFFSQLPCGEGTIIT